MAETEGDPQSYEQPPVGDDGVAEALAAGQPAMRCDRPDLFGTREAVVPVEVAGWATSPAGIEAVLVTIDGRTQVKAATGIMRPELTTLLGEQRTTDCGFFARLDSADCPPGWHELTVVAMTGDGRSLGVSSAVYCVRPEEAKANPIEPLPAILRTPPPERYARYGWAAGLVSSGKVLDVGCGSGSGTAMLAAEAHEAIGIDFSPPVIEDAKRSHGEQAQFRQADMRELPFADEEFDAVVCFEAISHVAEPEPVLDELRRVLRPTGLLLISSPNRDVYPPGNPLHLSEMSSEELERLLSARFANVAVHYQQTYFASLLGTAPLLAHDDPAKQISTTVTKVAGGMPGSELHAVAVASDGELPAEPAQLVLGDDAGYKEQQALLREWQERAVLAEAESHAHFIAEVSERQS